MNSNIAKKTIMRSLGPLALGFSLLLLAGQASAQTQVTDAWVRATVPGQQSTGAFMTFTASNDSKLLSAASPVARIVQIHQTVMKNDIMSMHEVKYLSLPEGKAIKLDPHGYHVMLMNLKAQIKEGDKVPLTLIIENASGEKETFLIQAPVRALNASDQSQMN
ncbi:MAG: copper chaperone PCu(A)C [Pseudomonas gingeri]